MAIQITIQLLLFFYQNESQSDAIIKIRRYQIKTLDLEIMTNFHIVSDCIKIKIIS